MSSDEVRPNKASGGMQAMKEVGLLKGASEVGIVVNIDEGKMPPE